MKKLSPFLSVTCIISLTFFTGCNRDKDEPQDPKPVLTSAIVTDNNTNTLVADLAYVCSSHTFTMDATFNENADINKTTLKAVNPVTMDATVLFEKNSGSNLIYKDFTLPTPGEYDLTFFVETDAFGTQQYIAQTVKVVNPAVITITQPANGASIAYSAGGFTLSGSLNTRQLINNANITITRNSDQAVILNNEVLQLDGAAPGQTFNVHINQMAAGDYTLKIIANDACNIQQTITYTITP